MTPSKSSLIILALAVGLLVGNAAAGPNNTGGDLTQRATRAPIAVAEEADVVTVTDSSAATAQLNPETVYSINCDIPVNWEWGDAAAATADTSSDRIPADMLVYKLTGNADESRYISFVRIGGTSGTCWVARQK